LRCNCGDQIRPSLLWGKPHLGSINEKPVAEATLLRAFVQGPEDPCSLRKNSRLPRRKWLQKISPRWRTIEMVLKSWSPSAAATRAQGIILPNDAGRFSTVKL
jgi:hypothetical protein